MPLKETLPAVLAPLLPEPAGTDDALRLSVEADLDQNGNFSRRWLAVTDERLYVFEPDHGEPRTLVDVPLTSMSEVKAQPLVGSGVLEATVDGRPMELVRYSNAMIGKFIRVQVPGRRGEGRGDSTGFGTGRASPVR